MNEINKLKAEHDALYEQGAEHLRLMNECGEKVAAQAVVIEKLRSVLEKLACLGNGDEHGNSIGNCIAIEALSIPTDSKEVLKEWLDNEIDRRAKK